MIYILEKDDGGLEWDGTVGCYLKNIALLRCERDIGKIRREFKRVERSQEVSQRMDVIHRKRKRLRIRTPRR